MTEPLRERDAMFCRHCGREERASEGYPCARCGTFLCQLCAMRGVTLCQRCTGGAPVGEDAEILRIIASMPPIDPPVDAAPAEPDGDT